MSTIAKSSAENVVDRDREIQVRRVAAASLVGTTIEWYDFLVYATMAGVIFNRYFFAERSIFVNTLLAYGTFAAGFFMRPLGGLLFGHFGDRIGRKPLLVLALVIMGIATFLIGLLPTYQQIGVWAPVLLVTLRLVQGTALGGEWGGAVLMAYEFARPQERAYYACFPQIGLAVGLCCSTGVVSFLSFVLSERDFDAWGWRVAFMLSIALLAVGLFICLRVLEMLEFARTQARNEVVGSPADVGCTARLSRERPPRRRCPADRRHRVYDLCDIPAHVSRECVEDTPQRGSHRDHARCLRLDLHHSARLACG